MRRRPAGESVVSIGDITLRYSADFTTLRASVGSTLHGLARDQYFVNGRPWTESDGSLEMRFDDGHIVLLELAGDGESVRAVADELEVPERFEVSPGTWCSWARVDLGRSPELGRLVGEPVVAMQAVIDAYVDRADLEVMSGWIMHFARGDYLVYLNEGGDSRILLNQLPMPQTDLVRMRLQPVAAAHRDT